MSAPPDPYRGADAPNAATQVFGGLWREFLAACKSHPRGMFAKFSDEGVQSRLLLAAVATIITPVIVEVSALRRDVAALQKARES